MDYSKFKQLIQRRGQELYRDMPWRRDTRSYYVLVSELMLQQTQVGRVIPKFEAFTARFPDMQSLAVAPLADVLKMWSGLGYNRRAKFLHEAAKQVVAEHGCELPADYELLKQLPGIGPATAGAIMTYAFNQPVVFIETNVRTVYFHYFFAPDEKVSDAQVAPLIEATLDRKRPREFYWALMDYGAWLKQNVKRNIDQSEHYKKQSRFRGSVREMRGEMIRLLGAHDMTRDELQKMLPQDDRFTPALEGLMRDGLVAQSGGKFHLTR